MISKSNYFKEVKNIDYKSLPKALKVGFDIIESGSMNYTIWKYLEQDKEFIDVYFQKLNKFFVTQAKSIETKKAANVTKVTKPIVTNVTIVTKPKTKKKEAKKSKPKAKIKKPSANSQKPIAKSAVKEVEKVPEEIGFIKRFVLLNGKVKTKRKILLFINALQKAITEKRIRKTSTHAKEIIHIQEQLIKLYNKMPEQIKVDIDSKTFEKYNKIANSEKKLAFYYLYKTFYLHSRKNQCKRKGKTAKRAIGKSS